MTIEGKATHMNIEDPKRTTVKTCATTGCFTPEPPINASVGKVLNIYPKMPVPRSSSNSSLFTTIHEDHTRTFIVYLGLMNLDFTQRA